MTPKEMVDPELGFAHFFKDPDLDIKPLTLPVYYDKMTTNLK
jgi:hypothetical protein